VRAALARVEEFFLEPAEPGRNGGPDLPVERRPVAAVFGLAPGCGATVVARALALELASSDPSGTAAVASHSGMGGIPLASPAAGRLARALADVPRATTRAVGRLCLVDCPDPLALADGARELAPLVLDAGNQAVGGAPAAVADRLLVVASPRVEPALAAAASACLARIGGEPLVVLNRRRPHDSWDGEAASELPESRMGAQLVLAGREPRGELGRAVAALARLVGQSDDFGHSGQS
jgi:hypothetical protein